MTVIAYALGGLGAARQTALGATTRPNFLPFPNVSGPCVALYSDTLNRWSDLYYDDGQITSAAWAADPLLVADTADGNGRTIASAAEAALTTNQTYLAIASPSNAQVLAQTRALTRQMDGVIRLLLGQLDTTAGI